MHRALRAVFWVVFYLALVTGSLFLMRLGAAPLGRSFWTEFSVAIGFLGLAQVIVQFALIARFKRLSRPYGIDAILYYHRQIGMLAVIAVVAHPVILALEEPAMRQLLNPMGGNWASRTGVWAAIALVAIVVLSIFRRRLRLSYESWRITHMALALGATGLAIAHLALAGPYVVQGWKLWYWFVLGGLAAAALAYVRLVNPLWQWRRPFRIVEFKHEADRTWTLVIEPNGNFAMCFEPGQFAWLKLGSPLSIDEHPFSFSSSAEHPERLEFGIKQVGDFTNDLPQVELSTPVYLDGPHGSFSIDQIPSAGYVFIAGGIGVVPIMSMIRTMNDRCDCRPVLLIYAAKRRENMAYRAELDVLSQRNDAANLRTLFVLEEPPSDWEGEVGFVTPELLARQLPKERIVRDYFICGPDPMIASTERALERMGVAKDRIHSERFDLV